MDDTIDIIEINDISLLKVDVIVKKQENLHNLDKKLKVGDNE